MPHPLEAGTIRILKIDGSTAGTGFLVSKRLAVTCAHVVTSAKSKPGDLIKFKYHLGDLEAQQAKVLENGWSTENDVAILELTEKTPK
jgi:V8-like Glu-specific endopeptidase